jgi:D-tyrosyl-tRNA(Tyr) deacylase
LYEQFKKRLSEILGIPVPSGRFGAMMDVALVNDGPVTLILDSRLRE